MARIPYQDQTDIPEQYHGMLTTHLESSLQDVERYETVKNKNIAGGPKNIYRLLAHKPMILRSHREHLSLMWKELDIPSRDRELALLCLAKALNCKYEWHHHTSVAADEGISTEEMRAIAAGSYDEFEDHEAALLEYAEHYAGQAVNDSLHARIADTYYDAQMLGLAVLLGFYVFLAFSLDALAVDLEEEFVGWDLENF
jgi:4-carboxymuconolactone decarboxylase